MPLPGPQLYPDSKEIQASRIDSSPAACLQSLRSSLIQSAEPRPAAWWPGAQPSGRMSSPEAEGRGLRVSDMSFVVFCLRHEKKLMSFRFQTVRKSKYPGQQNTKQTDSRFSPSDPVSEAGSLLVFCLCARMWSQTVGCTLILCEAGRL